MSGRALLRTVAARVREAVLGAGGAAARRRALPGMARRDGISGGWAPQRLWEIRPFGGGGEFGGLGGGHGGGKGGYGGGEGGGNPGTGAKSRGKRRGGGKKKKQKIVWWRELGDRLKRFLKSRNWVDDVNRLHQEIETAERAQGLPGRIWALGWKTYEGMAAAGAAVSVTCVALSEKLKRGAAAAKVKAVELKEVVKEKLSPTKVRLTNGPLDSYAETMAPEALDFSA